MVAVNAFSSSAQIVGVEPYGGGNPRQVVETMKVYAEAEFLPPLRFGGRALTYFPWLPRWLGRCSLNPKGQRGAVDWWRPKGADGNFRSRCHQST